MSWIAKLVETYDQSLMLGLPQQENPIPIHHKVQNAHINIVINSTGDFLAAKVLEREKRQIVLPATEASAGRTGKKPPPHPLADKLQYVAKDYANYGNKGKSFFDSYIKQLKQWCESDFSHPYASAVYHYVKKGTVIQDLINCSIIHISTDGTLLTKWEDENIDPPLLFKSLKKNGELNQGSAVVCWTVEVEGDPDSNTWQNESIQEKWIAYNGNTSIGGIKGLCYVSGVQKALTINHPAQLRGTGDSAKLISANDMDGFTFRGRFTDTKTSVKRSGLQGATIGGITSQKAHNALRWLIKRQGIQNGAQAIVAWAVSGKEIPDPLTKTTKFDFDDFSESSEQSVSTDDGTELDHSIDLGQSYARKLESHMSGYLEQLDQTDTISILAIDSATKYDGKGRGRMVITYYREYLPREYLDQISKWYDDLAWYQRVQDELGNTSPLCGKVHWLISAPTPNTILKTLYSDASDISKTLKKNLLERLLPCVVESRPLPLDIANNAVRRASNRHIKRLSKNDSTRKSELEAWEKDLGVACALYRGYLIRNLNRRKISMSLELNNNSRDYLFGRLLALAENIENYALTESDKDRPTNAERLMQRFADRPASTWKNIRLSLNPYMQRLMSGNSQEKGFIHKRKALLDKVTDQFDSENFILDQPLTGEFLLGFHSQRLDLFRKGTASQKNDVKLTQE